MGYNSSLERGQFNLQWISIPTESKRKFAFWNIWSAEAYSYDYMQWFLCVTLISNRDAYWTVEFKVPTFLCFWSVWHDEYWSASRHMTVQGVSLVKSALPKDARCLIRNKCSQTETQTHHRDPVRVCLCLCACICIFLALGTRGARMAGIELRWSRTCTHGHLPVHDASQETDKPKLLFIPQLHCKCSSLLSLMQSPQSH